MKKTENNSVSSNKKTLAEMSDLEIITQCGRLKYPIDKTLSVLYSQNQRMNTDDMRQRLTTAGTAENRAYQSGMDAADFEADSTLLDAAISGDPDSQELLRTVQKEKAIGDSIRESFFPDNDA